MSHSNGPDLQKEQNSLVTAFREICYGVPEDRAKELIEAANGNLERALDLFFHQQEGNRQRSTTSVMSTPTKSSIGSPSFKRSTKKTKRTSPASKSPGPKQARLDRFFGSTPSPMSPLKQGFLKMSQQKARNSTPGKVESTPVAAKVESTPVAAKAPPSHPDSGMSTPAATPTRSLHSDLEVAVSPPTKSNVSSNDGNILSFESLAETLQLLSDTTKRLEKLDILKSFLSQILLRNRHTETSTTNDLADTAQALTVALQLMLGFRTAGNTNIQDDAPMNVSGAAISQALLTNLGASRMQLSKANRRYGDLGDAAASLFQKTNFFVHSSKMIKRLTMIQVLELFQTIVATDGRDAKQHVLLKLFRDCQSKVELRFMVRLLLGNMRVGANLKTVLAGLAMAVTTVSPSQDLDVKPAIELVQKTHDICPNLGRIVDTLVRGGFARMRAECTIQVMTPLAPMLAHPIHSLDQIEKEMKADTGDSSITNPMTMEWKYDGVRCQAHFDGTSVKLYSRHMLDTTAQYQDAANSFLHAAVTQDRKLTFGSFIVDAEIVGVEGEGKDERLLPFQDLSRRKRKHDDGQGVRVKVFAFDIMLLDGVSYIHKPLNERRQALHKCFTETRDFAFVTSQSLDVFDENRIRCFLENAVKFGAEGLMMKMLGRSTPSDEAPEQAGTKLSHYEAGTRSRSWLKVKKDYVAGYAETIDVVPIGAWYGNGRKAREMFLSPVLLAVYDEDEEVYRSICRCMTFTDAMYKSMREYYFLGTPYPPGADVSGVPETNTSIADSTNGAANEEEEQVDSDSNHEEEEENPGGPVHDSGDGQMMVNCHASRPSSSHVVTNESPPIWFKPMEVFEVSFADMTLSKRHTAAAGLVDTTGSSGVALRFPRFKRRRPDKRPDQATTCLQIAELFASQSKQGSKERG